ncbi:hypothetical protein O1611_g7074 [Lasiodiplodia mahajangana]|uniref:Uncharacterized protein n=1 Tax=Lasiodiplodia mahajangana TaxID=1108764 RepID=A0ACC2JH57_9PEZI|nr:hypothetical protein O1611_g7074 [Lasiodiplodia mahajangana]
MSPPRREEPKPYRLYVALYNLGSVYHWAFVVQDTNGTFLLDATVGDGHRRYRKRNWENDLSKRIMSVLCDVMDLGDDSGVENFLRIAESAPMPDPEDQNFCQTWAEDVLEKAGGNGYVLRAPINRIREIVLQEASSDLDRKFGDPFKVVEPFNPPSYD